MSRGICVTEKQCECRGMILNYYLVSQMYDLVLLGDILDIVIGYNSVILPPDR